MIKAALIILVSFSLGVIFGFAIADLLNAARWHDDLEE